MEQFSLDLNVEAGANDPSVRENMITVLADFQRKLVNVFQDASIIHFDFEIDYDNLTACISIKQTA